MLAAIRRVFAFLLPMFFVWLVFSPVACSAGDSGDCCGCMGTSRADGYVCENGQCIRPDGQKLQWSDVAPSPTVEAGEPTFEDAGDN